MDLVTRRFGRTDLEAVLRIEETSFPSAWTAQEFRRALAGPDVRASVVERGGEVVGFWLVRSKPRRLHLLNLAVAAGARRAGVASFMLARIERQARMGRKAWIELEVRETNLPAQCLYRKAGYRAVEVLRGFYDGEDGYRMRRAPRERLAL